MTEDPIHSAAVELGRRGGLARARSFRPLAYAPRQAAPKALRPPETQTGHCEEGHCMCIEDGIPSRRKGLILVTRRCCRCQKTA